MAAFTREEMEKDFHLLEQFGGNAEGKIELIEHKTKNIRLIKRTYHEDKREVFELLSKADSSHLSRIEAVFFGTDTIVLEEYIEGETLHEYLGHAKVSSKQASSLIRELANAVSAIHKLGIIHRDIKPENILIDKSGHLHLIDFGIARIYRPGKEKDTQLLGTVGYAAPEQFGYAQSDFRSDVYSIGATCRDISAVSGKNRLLQKIEKTCMKMDPEERYPDASAVLSEFRKNKIKFWCRAVAAVLFLMLLGLGAYFLMRQNAVEEKKGDVESVPGENSLFAGQDDAPYLMLTEESEKRTELSLGEQEEPVEVLAKLTAEGLFLRITDSAGNKSEFELSNQYEAVENYPDTSMYAQVLFFDADRDGRDELWIAVSDRREVPLSNGDTAIDQNYMAGWCIFQDENGGFRLADGQLFTEGKFEIGTVVPDGIWQEFEFEGYRLKDGSLEIISW